MPKTKKKKKATPTTGKLAGKKVAFAGKFGYSNWDRDQMKDIVKLEGGKVVDGEKKQPDILVAGTSPKGGVPGAVAKIQKKYPAVLVMSENDFYQLTTPTAAELDAILRKAPNDWNYWYSMGRRLGKLTPKLDLSGRDFRNVNFRRADLENVNIDHCDFRGAKLENADLGTIRGANFDGTKLPGFNEAEDCSFKNADLSDGGPDKLTRCDFTGAKMTEMFTYDFEAADCIFRKANLSESDFSDARFKNCDFSQANLRNVDFRDANLSGANLSGADLSGANLKAVDLKNADLSNANLTNAFLGKATLTGAILDGADFTGASLGDANLKNVNVSKAKNLVARPPRTAGPHLKKLLTVVKQSKEFTTTIELTLGKNENVVLQPRKSSYGSRTHYVADYDHNVPAGRQSMCGYDDAKSFEEAILKVADRWSYGKPKFETTTIQAKKCPKKGEELQKLVYTAWCEVLDVPVPTGEELEKQQAKLAGALDAMREKLLAELRSGATGVAKWNKRDHRDQKKIGSLREVDFSGEKMAEVEFNSFDLRDAKFEGTSLRKADLWNCQFQKASFKNANLNGADLISAKCQEANFEGATLTDVTFSGNFQKANFRNADLTKADLAYCDLQGADFTGATLTNTKLDGAKFDNDTKFPSGFTPPGKMVWKGTGSRPGQRAVKVSAPGSMDFDTFFKNLGKKIEAAKIEKATKMLKADRFQLFADVTDSLLVGVVKSQTDKDLVYSCRLAADGQFGCGTQNLKPCGGLQGSLCKHLLVLVVGLAKAGKIDPATVYAWADASTGHAPALDKDGMSDTFLKYKGAEAGTVDWRPTETIPEDYYAM